MYWPSKQECQKCSFYGETRWDDLANNLICGGKSCTRKWKFWDIFGLVMTLLRVVYNNLEAQSYSLGCLKIFSNCCWLNDMDFKQLRTVSPNNRKNHLTIDWLYIWMYCPFRTSVFCSVRSHFDIWQNGNQGCSKVALRPPW